MALGQPAVGAGASIIAVLLARGEGTGTDRQALYGRARDLVQPVCRVGPLDALCDIARHARRDAADGDVEPGVREAARAFLEALETEAAVEALLDAVESLGEVTADVEELIEAAGESALWAITGRIERAPGTPASRALRLAVARRDEAWWRRCLTDVTRRALPELRPLFPLIRLLPAATAWPVAGLLLAHPDPEVRRPVCAFLLGLGEPDEPWRRLVADALQDTDRAVADMARAALLRFPGRADDLLALALDPRVAAPARGRVRDALEARRAGGPGAGPWRRE
ncbi:MAG: hypothetical protein Kow0062_13260 [Acidobacteriota bacterium]